MQINTSVVEGATRRIERQHGPDLVHRGARQATATLSADRADRVTRYVNVNRAPDDINALERAFGTNDLLSIYYFWSGLRVARSVGRILISAAPGDSGGSATGFLIAPGLLLTNWHVFKTPDTANRARVEFSYEADANGNERTPTWFSFASASFFIANEALDYCVVAVDAATQQGPERLESFGWLRLNPQLGKADYGQFLSIIQHPGGESKQIAIRENRLLPFDDAENFLTYRSDTFRGSSGSPVFNDLWDVVALHHSGKPLKDAEGHYVGHNNQPITDHQPQEDEIQWIANEGARTSKIVADLRGRAPKGEWLNLMQTVFDGKLAPTVQPMELRAASAALESTGTQLAPLADPSARGFTVTLPLNVAIRVESLPVPPTPVIETPATGLPLPSIGRQSPQTEELEFEKLNFDRDYGDRTGYAEDFLGRERIAPMPAIAAGKDGEIAPTLRRADRKLLHYHHFSAMIHAQRRIPVLTACNTDYSKGQRTVGGRDTFGKDEWIIDNRMDEKYQLPKGFYDRWKKLDYGHLVRREDNCWGASATEIEYANADTFHLTNCTPQHETFNRDVFGFHGLWGRLENHISSQATSDRALARLTILAGPIFNSKDLRLADAQLGDVFVPLAFWKVVVAPVDRGGIRAFGFITSQKRDLEDEPPFEEFTAAPFRNEQASLAKIEEVTIVRFGRELKDVDAMDNQPDGHELIPLESLEQVWLGRK